MTYVNEGRAAYHRGERTHNQPYSDQDRRLQWMEGWYDAEKDHRQALETLEPHRYLEAPQLSFI